MKYTTIMKIKKSVILYATVFAAPVVSMNLLLCFSFVKYLIGLKNIAAKNIKRADILRQFQKKRCMILLLKDRKQEVFCYNSAVKKRRRKI